MTAIQARNTQASTDRQELIGALVSSVGSLCLYLFSIAPTVQGFDSAELTVGAYSLGFVHPTGYPLYLLLGHLFSRLPLGEVGFRLNLMSAVFASLAVGMLFRLSFRQTRSLWPSLVSTALLCTAPIFWSQAIRAEVYTLHVFLVISVLLAWFSTWQVKPEYASFYLLICFLLLGLGMANHLTMILLWGCMAFSAFWPDRRLRKLAILPNMLGLLIACLAYLYFPWRSQVDLPVDYIRPYFGVDLESFQGLGWMVFGQAFHCLLVPADGAASLIQEVLRLAKFLWDQTLGFGLILGAWGCWKLSQTHPRWNRLLLLYFVANLVMFVAYGAVDKEAMFIPILVIIGLWAGTGIADFSEWLATTVFSQSQPETICCQVSALFLAIIAAGVILDWPSVSLRGDRQAYNFSRQILDQVGPSTVIVNHWATASVFDYLRIVENVRPDVESFNADFYFLGLQDQRGRCGAIEDDELFANGWFTWLEDLSRQNQLCFIEPLYDLPASYTWRKKGPCWDLRREGE